MKKFNRQLWIVGCWAFILTSCLKLDENYETWFLPNCLISSFSLQSDSIPELANVKFTIDQVNGLIYNQDSMPYGTKIDWKVICKVEFEVIPYKIEVFESATNDSTFWNMTDSLDFRDYVRFDIFAQDNESSKRYYVQLNIHQQAPDSMVWNWFSNKLLGKTIQEQNVIIQDDYFWMYVRSTSGYELYRTPVEDKKTWTPVPLTGLGNKTLILSQIVAYEGLLYMPASDGTLFYSTNHADWKILETSPAVKALLGVINGSAVGKTSSVLASIIQEDGALFFAAMNAAHNWEKGMAVPKGFPVSGFGVADYETAFYWHLLAIAGRDNNGNLCNVVWETMNGLNWVCLTDERHVYFDKREGVTVTHYDGLLFLTGGINTSNRADKDIFYSKDRGITWTLTESLMYFPENYRARGYASVIVDKDNYLHLFGGKDNNSANILDELWSGRINRLGFKD